MRAPTWVLFQIIGHMLGDQDMTGITAVHHPLRDVDPGSGNIGLLVEIGDFIDWAAVNAHSHPQLGMMFEFSANLDRAQDRRFGAGAENKGAAVARREREQLTFSLGGTELLGSADDLFQLLQHAGLLANEQIRIADDVDEQNMADLELHVWRLLHPHDPVLSKSR